MALAGAVTHSSLAAAEPNCTCRAFGQSYGLGQVLCIRGQLARCEMKLNNTSWHVLGRTCPYAGSPTPSIARTLEGPARPEARLGPVIN